MSPAAADLNLITLVALTRGGFEYFELPNDGRLAVYNTNDWNQHTYSLPIVLPADQQRVIAPLRAPGTTLGWNMLFLGMKFQLHAACDVGLIPYGRAMVLWAALDWLTLKDQATPHVSESLLRKEPLPKASYESIYIRPK